MIEGTSVESNSVAEHELQKYINRFKEKSTKDLVTYYWQEELNEIKTNAKMVSENERKCVRPVLKKILYSNSPWSFNTEYINEHLSNLAYSKQELEFLKLEKQSLQKRKKIIESEIMSGKNPWLAHVEHNERTILDPVIIGFYQDTEEKIRTIYGPRYFKSKRQIVDSILMSRTENKEVNLISGEFIKTQPIKVLKGNNWDVLPEDLRQHFERGELLVTGNNDIYNLNENELNTLANSENPTALLNIMDSKFVQAASVESKYYLLYYSDYGGENTGRTGVVMHTEGETIRPLVIKVGNKEFVLEVKGCGKKTGGFGKMQFRTGRNIITGGVEAEQAETEFYRLQDDKRESAPKSVGSIIFSNPDDKHYKQGYIIRLTPSTVRAAYTGCNAYPNIEKPEIVENVMDMYVSQLVEHIFTDPHKILDRSSHSENMLIWNKGEFTWTDYSDHVAFADTNFPHNDNDGGYMTPKQMLGYYIEMMDEIPGFNRDKQKFYTKLMTAFKNQGEDLSLEISDDYEIVAQKIWKSGMAYQVFRGKKDSNYIAEGVLNEFNEGTSEGLFYKDISFKDEDSFISREEKERVKILKTIELFQNKLGKKISKETINEWKQIVKEGTLSRILNEAKTFNEVYFDQYDIFTENERGEIHGSTDYFVQFESLYVSKLMQYFEHELDVISTAKSGNHVNDRNELERAEEEIKERIRGFIHLMDTDLRGFYKLLSNPEQVKKLISFSFYGH